MKKFWVIFSLIMANVFWGCTFVAFKVANVTLEPFAIIFIRLLISVPFLFLFAWLTGRMMRIRRKDFKLMILLAVSEPLVYFFGEAFGLSLVSSTLGAIIISTIPLFMPFAAYFFLRERLSLTNIVGLIISFAGVIMVVLASEGKFSGNLKGILLLFLAVLSAVAYTILAKKLIHRYNGIIITAWQSTLGMIMFLPFFLIFEVNRLDIAAISPESIWSVLYLAIFGSGICFILFTYGLRELGASKANVFANLIPVVTAIVSYFLLKEAMPLVKILGIIVVLAGLFLTQMKSFKRANSSK